MSRLAKDHLRAETSPPIGRQLRPILLLTSIFFFNFVARIILAPLMPNLAADLTIDSTNAGFLFLLISAGYFISLLGSGYITAYLTYKQTITCSVFALSLASFIIALSSGLWGLYIGLFCLGFATGPYVPSGIAVLTALTTSRNWGKAIAIHELAPNLAFILGPLMVEAILSCFSWRATFLFLGILGLILGGAYAGFGRGGRFKGQLPNVTSLRVIFSNPAFWIMLVLCSLGISAALGVYTMLPLYLVVEYGFERNWANTLIAVSRVVVLGIVFFGGWATDRFGARQVLKVVFILSGSLTLLLGLADKNSVAAVIVLQTIMAACFFPAGMAALSMITPPQEQTLAISLTLPLAFLFGGGVIPTLIGFIGDIGSFRMGIGIVGGLTLLGAILPGYLKFYHQGDE